MKPMISIVFLSILWITVSAQINDESATYKSTGLDKMKNENYAEAILAFSKSIELCSPEKKYDLLETYHCRAYCKSILEDYRGAIGDYEKIISLSEQWNRKTGDVYSTAFYFKGLCEWSLNKKEEACKDWSKSGELGYSKAYTMIKENCKD